MISRFWIINKIICMRYGHMPIIASYFGPRYDCERCGKHDVRKSRR